jgi:short-subunit dehydrogenase
MSANATPANPWSTQSVDAAQLRSRYGQWALIAGGSEGVGAEFARQLAAAGINSVLVARRREPLEALAQDLRTTHGVQIRTASIDLSEPDATARLAQEVEGLQVGLFIYNAGGDPNGSKFLDAPLASWQSLVRRNVDTLMSSVHVFGKRLVQQGRGGIIIVTSEAAFGGASRLNVYSGTKGFGLNLGESLWIELKRLNVDVLNLVLGSTDTPTLRSALAHHKVSADNLQLALPQDVVRAALANLPNGPTLSYNEPAESTDSLRSGAVRRKNVLDITAFLNLFYGEDN